MTRTGMEIKRGGAITAALVLAISMFGGVLHAEELGWTEHTVTVPGATPAVHFEFDDDNALTPPVVVSADSVENLTLTYSWNATNPVDLVTIVGKAKKCHPHSRINQVIKVTLNDAGAALKGSLSYQERDTNGHLADEHFYRFAGDAETDGGRYDLSLCVR